MDRSMKQSFIRRSLTQFILCVALLLLAATPLFYMLTKNFYAEDMIEVIRSLEKGQPVPVIDLEEDILNGIVWQYILISAVLGLSIVLMMRFIAGRLWRPFNRTLSIMEQFRLEEGVLPVLPESNTTEFARLNTVLGKLMAGNLQSYRVQKEFTENASHELQTPLAVFQSKLDILLQQPDLTAGQAAIIQELYQMVNRLSRLNRNLLLLAKMENRQFAQAERVDVAAELNTLLPQLECMAQGVALHRDFRCTSLPVKANRPLLESMINNLFVNAVRHNRMGGGRGKFS